MKFSKILFAISSVSLLPICACTKGNSETVNVILMCGQSNMEGHEAFWSTLDKETQTKYKTGHNNIKINYNCTYELNYEHSHANTSNGKFVDVDFGQGRNKDLMGPEVGFADYLGDHDASNKYYLIKSCEGSSSVHEHWKQEGRCYQTLLNDVDASIKQLEDNHISFKIVAFIWMQGEDDAKDPENALNYENNMLDLLNRINTKYKNHIADRGMSVIDGGITTDGIWQYASIVNLAKKHIASSNKINRYVSESEALPKVSPWHYSPTSYLTLGEAFARAYLETCN